MTVRVLLADDEALVRTGIALILRDAEGIETVGFAADGREAVEQTRALRPDVVLVDVRMPVLDGVEATRRIVEHASDSGTDCAVLVLSTFHVDEAVRGALRAGASGFVLKDAAPDELVSAIRAVAAGEAWLDPAVARGLLDEFKGRPDSTRATTGDLARLTPRECEVLVLVAHGLSNTEIAEHLVISEGTVKTHVNRLFAKLGVGSRAQAVVAAYRGGLVAPDEPPPPVRR
ncbi:response regulator transcription factor [Cellulomonas sp. H30R-01]|uniref:response regulator n=1 Tax=Cellulomonas sp. H30R-01 TaxID=2704467 RepID=UPI00138D179D|nr:response regulator transcription factor [Cellulomonas sp. H30R-01]QHT56220.1 response regulator transcription factor [Cellulomonas sp. H30R-01]